VQRNSVALHTMNTNVFEASHFNMVAKTQYGLEEVLSHELTKLGASDVQIHNRAVSFSGSLKLMYEANLHLRTALKILLPVAKFKAENERDLYEEIRRIEWDKFMDVDGTLAVHASIKSTFFNHTQYISQKTKDGIVDFFRDKYGRRPSVELIHPDLSIDIHIYKDDVTVSLDSSGESLHRRGYRGENTLAPINEVTAAGMILLTGWDGKGNFVDPMCGSGTLLIEAALYARNIPPNQLRKKFGFHSWKNVDVKLWNEVKQQATDAICDSEATFTGCDKTFKAIDIARGNVERAGLDEDIRLSNKRFEELIPPAGGGIVIMNPPYGERLPVEEIAAFYKMIGDKLKKDFEGYTAWIISSNVDALKRVGLAASKRLMLYNGALECKFHKYELYKGTRRKTETEQ
jgi:putative N6-adenine-specific DNA methylase